MRFSPTGCARLLPTLMLLAALGGCASDGFTSATTGAPEGVLRNLACKYRIADQCGAAQSRRSVSIQHARQRVWQAGRYDEALTDLNKAISIRPDNAQAYYNRGLFYHAQQQHNYAIDDFTTAIGLSVQQAEPYVARGLSYIAAKNHRNAADDLDQAVTIEPQNVQAWMSH